ncbi:MAG: DISARM system SNF2-like helicase DrmD, partial [Candidatus Thorarchaeota archaeon]
MAKAVKKTPEPGQFVVVRNRHCVVEDVSPSGHNSDEIVHRVTLECLDDDRFGDKLDVIWEREVNCEILSGIGLPEKISWDPLKRFEAFIHSIMWSSVSLVKEQGITAPFRSAVDIEEYQMVPILRALQMPQVNLLLADDVGLGKTIEAGLVAQELIARKVVQRIMVLCPAALQKQWQEEMFDKFGLVFRILDSNSIFSLRREYGLSVNPWAVYPRVITSMDFLKRSEHLQAFQSSIQRDVYSSAFRDWDLLIVDEAHNIAPSGRKSYIRDSQRTRMMLSIKDSFENRLFLTATPHNGYSESFTALLELLDPLRFSRGTDIDKTQLSTIMIRRMKDDIRSSTGERIFPERIVQAIPVLDIIRTKEETEISSALEDYAKLRLSNPDTNTAQVRFSLILLKKRFLSSPLAFANSIIVHAETVRRKEEERDESLIDYLADKVEEEFDDDVEKSQYEKEALRESSKFFDRLTSKEGKLLEEMLEKSTKTMSLPDGKAQTILEWIKEKLQLDNKWNDERLIIFTEYLDTLHYLKDLFIK